MKFKENCRLLTLQPQAVIAMVVAQGVFQVFNKEFVVTSVNDSTHMDKSLHYSGLAFDIRTRDLTPEQQNSFLASLRAALTIEYDVVLESDHVHVEYDAKKTLT